MARVTTPTGDVLDVTSAGALAYYRREPGYIVDDGDTATVTEVTVDDGNATDTAPVDDTAPGDVEEPHGRRHRH
jgi:hypothetical protein